ncbi:hypothetical protein RGAI101_316 [Roseobacter sp. GAI101]|nr:hypothetical protein RGAI101_316 [Roseobacter sp. GAI101]
MLAKPFATRNKVVIDDAQISKPHVLGVIVISKAETMR